MIGKHNFPFPSIGYNHVNVLWSCDCTIWLGYWPLVNQIAQASMKYLVDRLLLVVFVYVYK